MKNSGGEGGLNGGGEGGLFNPEKGGEKKKRWMGLVKETHDINSQIRCSINKVHG